MLTKPRVRLYKKNMTFLKQFTGSTFWWLFGGALVLDLLSFFAFGGPLETLFFVLLGVGILLLGWKRPEWLFPLALTELITTSNGHSLNIEVGSVSIGLRILLFFVLMLVTALRIIRTKDAGAHIPQVLRLPLGLLASVLLYGILLGVLNGNSLRSLYLDANGYLAVGYLLAALVWMQDRHARHHLLQAVGAGVSWITLKTLLLFFAFGHLHPKTLDPLYRWIRDTRLGEITLQRGNVYRIFLQSQWFLVPALFVSASYMLLAERIRENGVRIVHMLTFAAMIVTLSRTFWLALVVLIPILVVYVWWHRGWRVLVSRIPDLALTKIGSIALLWILIAVPLFQTVGSGVFSGLLRDRATNTADTALDSRRQLLPPMLATFLEAPLAGSGLGTEVTYITADKRYMDTNGTNVVSTYAFEWGWIDLLIKFGVVGTAVFVLFLTTLAQALWRARRLYPHQEWLYCGLLATLGALVVTHMFSPYLNHPIGWGMLALMVALIPWHQPEAAPIDTKRVNAVRPVLQSFVTRKR